MYRVGKRGFSHLADARAAIQGTDSVIVYDAAAVAAYDDSAIRPQVLRNAADWSAMPTLYTVMIASSDGDGERVGESVNVRARSSAQAESIVGAARPDAEVLDSWKSGQEVKYET